MSYTQIALVAVLIALVIDLFVLKTRLILTAVFWTSYAIILPFQRLTSRNIVMYNPDAIIGIRIAAAPVEDLLFGFALVLAVLAMWITRDPN